MQPRDLGIGRLFDHVRDAVIVADARDGRIVLWNAAATAIFGYTAAEIVGERVQRLVPPRLVERHERGMANFRDTGRGRYLDAGTLLELPAVRKDGEEVVVEMSLSPIPDPADGTPYALAVLRDVTERRSLEWQLARRTLYDPLTELPNRTLFVDRLEHQLRNRRGFRPLAVMFVDVDRFKEINGSFGHAAGDRLLVLIADRLRRCLRQSDTIARVGEDQFAILVAGGPQPASAARIAERIRGVLLTPFPLEDHEVTLTVSMGIAQHTSADDRAEDLLRHADLALNEAKRLGRGRYEMFDVSMRAHPLERLELESDLRRAVEREEFRVVYQPQVSLATGRISGWEALVRWEHPRRGLLSPGDFLAVAEELGLIVPIGRFVFREACATARDWQRRDPVGRQRVMSINLSAPELETPDLIEALRDILAATDVEPASIEVEITERVVLAESAQTLRTLQAIKELGLRLAIDDFGTGYNFLLHLKSFPVERLKIDRSFVDGLGTDADDTIIVSAIVGLAHDLGLEVVAEGVERPLHAQRLRQLGCETAQGYHFSRPLTRDAAGAFVAADPVLFRATRDARRQVGGSGDQDLPNAGRRATPLRVVPRQRRERVATRFE